MPGVRPVTTPPGLTLAVDGLLLLQVPPEVPPVADKPIVWPMHTLPAPVMVPALGAVVMVITFVADTLPHALLTV